MKLIFSVALLIAGLLMQPLYANAKICEATLPITGKNLTGTWISLALPFKVTVKYKIDGTFSGVIEDHGQVAWRYAGTWKLKGHTFYTVYTYSSLQGIPVGTKDSDYIISVGCGIVTYRSKQGGTKLYQRVGP